MVEQAGLACPKCAALGEVHPACDRCRGTGKVCRACGGMGYRYSSENPMDSCLTPCQECRVVALREMDVLSELDGLRGDLLGKTFKGFETMGLSSLATAAFNAAAAWAADPKGWLFVHGTVGAGKTHLAAAAANHLRAEGRAVLFVRPRLLRLAAGLVRFRLR